jgi:hypothetical protein
MPSAPLPTNSGMLLGARLDTALDEAVFETRISTRSPAYLADHRVHETPILPATANLKRYRPSFRIPKMREYFPFASPAGPGTPGLLIRGAR